MYQVTGYLDDLNSPRLPSARTSDPFGSPSRISPEPRQAEDLGFEWSKNPPVVGWRRSEAMVVEWSGNRSGPFDVQPGGLIVSWCC